LRHVMRDARNDDASTSRHKSEVAGRGMQSHGNASVPFCLRFPVSVGTLTPAGEAEETQRGYHHDGGFGLGDRRRDNHVVAEDRTEGDARNVRRSLENEYPPRATLCTSNL